MNNFFRRWLGWLRWRGFSPAVIKPFQENWSEAVHYLFISLAILISAVWAIWTFNVFGERDRAVQELKNAQSELIKKQVEIQEIQARLDGNFSSDILIDSDVVPLENGKYGLIVDVNIKNVGTKDVVLNLEGSPLTIYKLHYSEAKLMATKIFQPQFYEKLSLDKDFNNIVFPVQKVLVGATKSINFFSEVDGVGMYYITFQAGLSFEQKERLNVINDDHVWFASTYVKVPKN